jgi:hypothetical protein
MRDDLAARLLAEVLGWNAATFADVGRGLQELARHKYDSYEGYRPGERFIESLAGWLWQFEPSERVLALEFVLRQLVMISRDELDHLIETVYPDLIRPMLINRAATESGEASHRIAMIARSVAFQDLQRKTLVLGLADGARLDHLRRSSSELSHEQFYLHAEMGLDSRRAMREQLSAAVTALGLPEPALFRQIVLVDDFAGSGYTLLSRDDDGKWRGKLWKAALWINDLSRSDVVAADASVWVLLYVASEQATDSLRSRLSECGLDWQLIVAQSIDRFLQVTDPKMLALCERYFDPAILDAHLAKGSLPPHLGFGGAALPLVLHHNTPNNSIGLLWADTTDRPSSLGRRALFPRRQRHNPDRP